MFSGNVERHCGLCKAQKTIKDAYVFLRRLPRLRRQPYFACMPTTKSSTTGSPAAKAAEEQTASYEAKTGAAARKADLRGRTSTFARDARTFIRKTPRTLASLSDCRNLVRSSGLLGASYIDADESGSREEFLRNMGNCRRQSRQSAHWLALLEGDLEERSEEMREGLLKEAGELERIFGAIIGKTLANARAKQKTV